MIELIMDYARYGFRLYYYILIAFILSSWVPSLRESKIGSFLKTLAEPYLNLFRFFPPIGMIDLSPIIALIVYNLIVQFAEKGIYAVLNLFI